MFHLKCCIHKALNCINSFSITGSNKIDTIKITSNDLPLTYPGNPTVCSSTSKLHFIFYIHSSYISKSMHCLLFVYHLYYMLYFFEVQIRLL